MCVTMLLQGKGHTKYGFSSQIVDVGCSKNDKSSLLMFVFVVCNAPYQLDYPFDYLKLP